MGDILDASMFHHAAHKWGSSSRTIGANEIGSFVTKDYAAEGDQLRMPDTAGKGTRKVWNSRLVTVGSSDQLVRMKVASIATTVQVGGSLFRFYVDNTIVWYIRDASGDNLTINDRVGVVKATFANPFSGVGTLDNVQILWQHSATGSFEMWVNGVSVVSVGSMDMLQGASGNSFLRLFGTHDAFGQRQFTIANYILETNASDKGTDDWYIPKYTTNSTGSGHTNANGVGGLAEIFDTNSWVEIVDNDLTTYGGYNTTNGITGAGAYTDKSGNRGPDGDSEILSAWVIRGASWGHRHKAEFPLASVNVGYGRWDGVSTVTMVFDGASTVLDRDFFVKAGVSPCPSKTDTGWLGFKRGGGSSIIGLTEAACFVVVDVVPAVALILGPPVFKSPKPVKSA